MMIAQCRNRSMVPCVNKLSRQSCSSRLLTKLFIWNLEIRILDIWWMFDSTGCLSSIRLAEWENEPHGSGWFQNAWNLSNGLLVLAHYSTPLLEIYSTHECTDHVRPMMLENKGVRTPNDRANESVNKLRGENVAKFFVHITSSSQVTLLCDMIKKLSTAMHFDAAVSMTVTLHDNCVEWWN